MKEVERTYGEIQKERGGAEKRYWEREKEVEHSRHGEGEGGGESGRGEKYYLHSHCSLLLWTHLLEVAVLPAVHLLFMVI